jgi:AcrR family transcriptional regulator
MVSDTRRKTDEKRKEQTRDRLLESAVLVLVRKGYRDTLISDIVGECGVGQGTFYRHFKSKRDILEELFDDFALKLLDGFADFESTPPNSLQEYVELSVNGAMKAATVLVENQELTWLFLREGPAIDTDFEQRLSDVFDQFATLARLYLEHAMKSGFARSCDAEIISQCLVGMARRLVERSVREPVNNHEMKQKVYEAVQFAFKGIGRKQDG